jgi:hypothetical protein
VTCVERRVWGIFLLGLFVYFISSWAHTLSPGGCALFFVVAKLLLSPCEPPHTDAWRLIALCVWALPVCARAPVCVNLLTRLRLRPQGSDKAALRRGASSPVGLSSGSAADGDSGDAAAAARLKPWRNSSKVRLRQGTTATSASVTL